MNLTIVCVYKTGGDFDAEYVEKLYDKIGNDYDFVCLTDANDIAERVPTLPLEFGWPKWWSKMEIFKPGQFEGSDILYFDLDTVIVSDEIDDLYDATDHNNMIMLSDFYFPKNLASGIMYIPYEYNEIFWNEFIKNPQKIINDYRGDQDFLCDVIHKHELVVDRWDQILPDYIASYKTNIIKKYPRHLKPLQVDATKSKIICFHGKPRPKDVTGF
ncbi:MAG: hypothetical protein R3230_00380 [Nitrosopumilaceae archaeon]|nr:hypothetical protein [Nitrosopumilaceae archaeon]